MAVFAEVAENESVTHRNPLLKAIIWSIPHYIWQTVH